MGTPGGGQRTRQGCRSRVPMGSDRLVRVPGLGRGGAGRWRATGSSDARHVRGASGVPRWRDGPARRWPTGTASAAGGPGGVGRRRGRGAHGGHTGSPVGHVHLDGWRRDRQVDHGRQLGRQRRAAERRVGQRRDGGVDQDGHGRRAVRGQRAHVRPGGVPVQRGRRDADAGGRRGGQPGADGRAGAQPDRPVDRPDLERRQRRGSQHRQRRPRRPLPDAGRWQRRGRVGHRVRVRVAHRRRVGRVRVHRLRDQLLHRRDDPGRRGTQHVGRRRAGGRHRPADVRQRRHPGRHHDRNDRPRRHA